MNSNSPNSRDLTAIMQHIFRQARIEDIAELQTLARCIWDEAYIEIFSTFRQRLCRFSAVDRLALCASPAV